MHKKAVKYLFLLSLCLILQGRVSSILAQEFSALPTLQPTFIDEFDELETYPNICFQNFWQSPDGRIFITSCTTNNQSRALFFQFDGKNFYPHRPALDFNNAKIKPKGFCNPNYYYGYVEGNGPIFLMDINSYETEIFFLDSLLSEEESILNICANEQGEWILYTQENLIYRLYSWSPNSLELLVEIKAPPNETEKTPTNQLALYHNQKEVWFFSKQKTIFRFDKGTKKYTPFEVQSFLSYTKLRNNQVARSFLNINFLEDHHGNIYLQAPIYTDPIFKFDRTAGRFIPPNEFPYPFQPEKIFKDRQGNLLFLAKSSDHLQGLLKDTLGQWYDYSEILKLMNNQTISLHIGGAFRKEIFILRPGKFYHVAIKELNAIRTYLPDVPLRGIGALTENQFWICGTGPLGGWFLINDKKRQVTRDNILTCLPEDLINQKGLSQIIQDSQERFWTNRRHYLICYNPVNTNCKSYPLKDNILLITTLNDGKIALLFKDRSVHFFDPNTQQTSPYLEDGQIKRFTQGAIQDLKESPDGSIWLATSQGLWKINPKKSISQLYLSEEPFARQGIYCIHPASDGKLWLGTYYSGVYIFNPKNEQVKTINTDQGLSNNSVVSIIPDEDGDLWVGTYQGLTLISPNMEVLTTIHPENGLIGKEFNRYSYASTPEGRILMGTTRGLNVLDPKVIKSRLQEDKNISIYLNSISFFDPKQDSLRMSNKNLNQIHTIQLPASNRFLQLRFALSNYTQPHLNRFAYQLIPKNKNGQSEWVYLGTQGELNLAHLPAGKYDLLIKGSDFRGNWTVEPLQLSIHAKDFFYNQSWFYLLCAMPFLLFGFLWFRRIQLETVRLEREVAVRTQKIQQDKTLIEQQAQKLKELDQMKSRFFTNISHELRTPLTVISGMVDQINNDPESWFQKGLKMIKRNSNNLLNLVNQILDLRKLESGKLGVDLIQADIIPNLRYIFESFESLAQNKDIKVHMLVEESSLVMDFDQKKLLRIVSNLLSNAIKFTAEGGNVYFIINNTLGVLKTPRVLLIKVKDTGIGIPPEKLPHIFKRFYQADGPDSYQGIRAGEGTGIGLALCKELVNLLGGKIEVESQEGKGSSFTVTLPITNEAPAKKVSEMAITHEGEMGLLGSDLQADFQLPQTINSNADLPMVLLVEDNLDVVQYLIACLEERFRLIIARDGQEGIEKAIETIPDAIISDVMMPHKDGFEVCETLKADERTSHIPIILLTAKADLDSRLSGLRKGADDYLIKPFNEEELQTRLENQLEIRRKLQLHFQNIQSLPSDSSKAIQQEDEFLKKIRENLEANIEEEDYGIQEICRDIGMSRAQLHRKLKALTGLSTSHYLRKVRLKKAKELLENTDWNVSQVAYAVGFRYPSNFSKAYHEEFGSRPSATHK